MINPASAGKTIALLIATGTLVTGYVLYGKKIDRIACEESRNIIQQKRNKMEATRQNLKPK